MSNCACDHCDGQFTYSEAWRHECEVRHVANLPTKWDRKRYLTGIRRRRGEAEVDRIKRGLHALHREALRAKRAT